MDLQGKVALIMGASSGIGRATAERMSARGAKVVINYNQNEAGASKNSCSHSKGWRGMYCHPSRCDEERSSRGHGRESVGDL